MIAANATKSRISESGRSLQLRGLSVSADKQTTKPTDLPVVGAGCVRIIEGTPVCGKLYLSDHSGTELKSDSLAAADFDPLG